MTRFKRGHATGMLDISRVCIQDLRIQKSRERRDDRLSGPATERAFVVSGGEMARPRMHVCAEPGCPTLTLGRRCDDCAAAYERRRGTRQARGYDAEHDRLRRSWARRVATGMVRCARCDTLIYATEAWALDHTDDRTGYLGPSHKRCNDSAGGKAAHQ